MEKIRKNIFKSFLFVCLGLAITTIAFAVARAPYDVPSPPGTPEILFVHEDRCEIKWVEPIWDGGSPILYYIIESQEMWTMRWVRKGTTRMNRYLVHPLKEGYEYRFRVIAVNAAGSSLPSGLSDEVLLEDPYAW